ncbi:transcription factor CYCLOIDEA-like [Melia azedarach]|uniref:Transcription factor CYCLOIDEA-like n=1 Tax=Melia azedarach TaxID=155640 RepID=A0ACC1XIM5_MELAZ|nr:transcription factor CYCLOIDEA-like [Melia azedarach]
MFPSSSNRDHFPFTNQSMLGSSFNNENPSSSRGHHPSPFLHFSESFLADDNELFMSTHFSSRPQILGSSSNQAPEAEIKTASPVKETKKITKRMKEASNVEKQTVPRRRTGKKDRHSKIYTANGPRDRRMRLSLKIARRFFDLQDMLGFDKASNTIEWLFSKSMAAIKELTESLPSMKNSCTGGAKSFSSTSESEVVSAIKTTADIGDQKSAPAVAESSVGTSKGAMNRRSRKPTVNPIVRESRNKARARARERTIEKMKMKGLEKSNNCSEEANPNDLEQLRSSSPLQTAENFGSSSQEKNSSLKVVGEEEEESCMIHLKENQMDSVSIIEKFLGITPATRSSSIFDYTQNIGESSGANSQHNNFVYAGTWDNADSDRLQYSYWGMTSMKGSTGPLR